MSEGMIKNEISQQKLRDENDAKAIKMVQLNAWVEGHSIHKTINGDRYCIPDSSCCFPPLKAPPVFRKLYRTAFLNGNDKLKTDLLNTFTMYSCKAQGFTNPNPDGKYYKEWLNDASLFSRSEIKKAQAYMFIHRIKY